MLVVAVHCKVVAHVVAGGDMCTGLQARVKFHVLLTTYEMAVAEGTVLRSLQYEAMVIDEGHRCVANASFAVLFGLSGCSGRPAYVPSMCLACACL